MLAFVACRKQQVTVPPDDGATPTAAVSDDGDAQPPDGEGRDPDTAPTDDAPPTIASPTPDNDSDTDDDAGDECNPLIAAPERRDGGLTVHAPPKEDRRTIKGRLRSHVDGALSIKSERVWVGPQVPGFVPLTARSLELFLLERGDGLFVALYRDPYGAGSCDLSGSDNCAFLVRAWDDCGTLQWEHRLNDFMSAKQHLEVQDMRWAGGTLYFNEACQSYSKQAKGKCSSLVALDPVAGEVRWRSGPRQSNNRFLVVDDYVITGYGFTAEPDYLFVLRASDGKKLHKQKIPTAHEDLALIEGRTVLQVQTNRGTMLFSLTGFESDKPSLKKIDLGNKQRASKKTVR